MGWFTVFRSRRMAVLFLLGFSSGLPLLLTGQTLQAWLTAEHVSLRGIAAMSLVGPAYTFKFTWAPLLDRFALPFLGRRRGWVLVFQIGLCGAIAAMSLFDPRRDLAAVVIVATGIAVLSASQDVVLDAYMTDVLAPHERAAGSSLNVMSVCSPAVSATQFALLTSLSSVGQRVFGAAGRSRRRGRRLAGLLRGVRGDGAARARAGVAGDPHRRARARNILRGPTSGGAERLICSCNPSVA